MGDFHGLEEPAEEFDATAREVFVGGAVEGGDVDAEADEGGGDFVGTGGGALVLEGAGVGADGDVGFSAMALVIGSPVEESQR